MGNTYKTLDQINPDLFRGIILGSDSPEVEEGSTQGLMSSRFATRPRARPVDLDTTVATTPASSFLTGFAQGMARSSDDRERLANAVVPRPTPRPADLTDWESMPPLEQTLQGDATRAALGSAEDYPVNLEGSTRGAVPISQQEGSDATSTLLDYISAGEGTYTSYNSGTVNGRIQHSSHDYVHNNTSLSDMTIGQIREQMSITDPTDPNRIYAAGRYQVIPSTLNAAVEALGLSDDTVFDQETQDKIGLYLISEKRPRVGRYIEGDENVTTERAMLDLAMEFASFPVPYAIRKGTYGSWPQRDIQAGESFYAPANSGSGTNRASHTLAETRSLLESIRGN